MELIISILFFALASAVCIQLFVKAHLMGIETIEQNKSLMWTQNLAELFIECEGNPQEIYTYLLASEMLNEENVTIFTQTEDIGALGIFFNKNFTPCRQDSQELCYVAVLSCQSLSEPTVLGSADMHHVTSGFDYANYSSSPDSYPLVYHIPLKHHIPSTLSDLEVTLDE